MIEKNKGALPSQTLKEFIENGLIAGSDLNNISPASLDLTISDEAYQVDEIFLPKKDESVRNILSYTKHRSHDLSNILEHNVAYLIRLNEVLKLPKDIYGYCNPKSTTGRNDVHVRILADGISRYDTVPRGFAKELWAVVIPKSFPIRLFKGVPLSQMRLFNASSFFKEKEFKKIFAEQRLLSRIDGKPYNYSDLKLNDNDSSIILTLDLSQDIMGYESRNVDNVLDFSKGVSSHEPVDFFEKITNRSDNIHLKKGRFYILSSHQAVRVPPELACEMVAMDEKSGEFRSHYAGYIDPGWGWGKKGEGTGRPLTLEVRPFEDLVIRHGQAIAKIRFERMADMPDVIYDCKDSNYIKQTGPKLSKHFNVN